MANLAVRHAPWDGSPYQCLSAHAGNLELIDIDGLVKLGWLPLSEDCRRMPETPRVQQKLFGGKSL